MQAPAEIEVARRNTACELVNQVVHPVDRERKRELLSHRIGKHNMRQVLVFTRTKHSANRLAAQLEALLRVLELRLQFLDAFLEVRVLLLLRDQLFLGARQVRVEAARERAIGRLESIARLFALLDAGVRSAAPSGPEGVPTAMN